MNAVNETVIAGQTVTFNAETFADKQRLAGNAWRNAETNGDTFARSAMAALVTGALSPLGLAMSIYDEMEPKKANGDNAEPTEQPKAPCGVSVSSLRSAKGGEGARKCLDTIFYIVENRDYDAAAVADFITGKKSAFRLFPLKAHISKAKAAAAKAEKEAAGQSDTPKEGADNVPADAEQTLADRIVAIAAEIDSADVSADGLDAAFTLLLESLNNARSRSVAAEQLQQAA